MKVTKLPSESGSGRILEGPIYRVWLIWNILHISGIKIDRNMNGHSLENYFQCAIHGIRKIQVFQILQILCRTIRRIVAMIQNRTISNMPIFDNCAFLAGSMYISDDSRTMPSLVNLKEMFFDKFLCCTLIRCDSFLWKLIRKGD